ncbi:purine permease 3-like [Aristolochia californica]|uniref:purine permease 3-like n=1 Tax=Aristolochia californica TaxID=171875 RepID=UPI0035DFC40B
MAKSTEKSFELEDGSFGANSEENHQKPRSVKCLLLFNTALSAIGTIGGPLLLRLYYIHGGNRKWVASSLQTAGFPLLVFPLSILFLRHRARGVPFMAEPKLLLSSAAIGLLVGLNNFLYSLGLSSLPVSTSSLLFSTQLAFTALFALIIVRQKFTPYSINAVVLMTLGAILLGIRKSSDRPPAVSNAEYLLGFLMTLAAASLLGFTLPCIELAYAKATKAINYRIVLQFQFGVSFFATVFCTIGMIINKDFAAITREASEFGLGETKYYLVLVFTAVVFQFIFVGTLGVIFCSSSLFAGVLNATMLPLTEVAGVLVYHEKFTGEKGMALALCLWGFTSYFYGSYREKEPVIESSAKAQLA